MLRSGRIVYTNDLPIYAAFDLGAVTYPGTLHADVPAELNARLLDGRLDLSPISAFQWAARADELVLLPELCIGARDEVWSVVCASREPLAALGGATIAVTRESASGLGLLRVLLERRYGVRARFEPVDDPAVVARAGRPAFLIGDSAIDVAQSLPRAHVHDLGAEWHAWTGTDMVFAVWAARRDAFERDPAGVHAAIEALVEARAWGAAHMDAVVELAQTQAPRPGGYYPAYFDTLNFDLDARARVGLARYAEELHAIGAIANVPSATPEVAHVPR